MILGPIQRPVIKCKLALEFNNCENTILRYVDTRLGRFLWRLEAVRPRDVSLELFPGYYRYNPPIHRIVHSHLFGICITGDHFEFLMYLSIGAAGSGVTRAFLESVLQLLWTMGPTVSLIQSFWLREWSTVSWLYWPGARWTVTSSYQDSTTVGLKHLLAPKTLPVHNMRYRSCDDVTNVTECGANE